MRTANRGWEDVLDRRREGSKMKSEMEMFVLFVAIGAFNKKITPRGWWGIGLMVFLWMMYSWLSKPNK